jgi:hypothetical protein
MNLSGISAFGATMLLGSCTVIGSLDRHVPVTQKGHDDRLQTFEPWDHRLGGHGLRLIGSAGSVRWRTDASSVSVTCQEHAWDQHWIGPILPVIPCLMGAGPYLGDLTMIVRAEPESAPVTIPLDQVSIRVRGASESHSPSIATLDEHDRKHVVSREIVLGSVARISPGDSLSLIFDVDCRSTDAFDLVLPVDGEPLTLAFQQERTRFLFFIP